MKLTRRQLRRIINEVSEQAASSLKQSKPGRELDHKSAVSLAKDLHSAMEASSVANFFTAGLASAGTDEERIGICFKMMKNSKEALKKVSELYKKMYKKPLGYEILDELNGEELFTYVDANFEGAVEIMIKQSDAYIQQQKEDSIYGTIKDYAEFAGKEASDVYSNFKKHQAQARAEKKSG